MPGLGTVVTVTGTPSQVATGGPIEDALTMYSWGDYDDPSLLKAFSKQLGPTITTDAFGSNEEMIAKLVAAKGTSGYDIVVPTGQFIPQMVENGLLAPINNPGAVQYELAKFNWLGSLNSETGVVFAMSTAPHKRTQDLFERELIVGANSNVDPELSPKIYNALIGTKFKIVTGYTGTNGIALAMERGEVQGIADWSWSSVNNQKPDWLKEGRIVALLQGSLERHKELPNLANALDFVRTDTDRKVMQLYFTQKTVARPVLAPPEVPAERIAILRAAFARLASDHEFLADAERSKLEAGPIDGAAVDAVIRIITSAPPEVIARFKAAMGVEGPR